MLLHSTSQRRNYMLWCARSADLSFSFFFFCLTLDSVQEILHAVM